MVVNDPVADLLTRIRNASRAGLEKMVLPSSKLKVQIVDVLKREGFITDYVEHEKKPQNELTVILKYAAGKEPVIQGIRRVSRPGLRRYAPVRDIPRVKGGMGISILSTSKGVMADHEARKQSVGGEVICSVY